jgi:hypothetical protein
MQNDAAKVAAQYNERTAQLIRRGEDDETVLTYAMARMSTDRFLEFLRRTFDAEKALTALILIERAKRYRPHGDSIIARIGRALIGRGDMPTHNRREVVGRAYQEWRHDCNDDRRLRRIRRKYRPFGPEIDFIVELIRNSNDAAAIQKVVESRAEYVMTGAQLRRLLTTLRQFPQRIEGAGANANKAAA